MKTFFKKLFRRGDFMTRADKWYYKKVIKTWLFSAFALLIVSWVGTNLVLCALSTNVSANWDIIFEAPKDIVMPTGPDFNATYMAYNKEFSKAENITFDYYTGPDEYVVNDVNLIAGATKKTMIGDAKASIDYYVCNSDKDVYILSSSNILANVDSSKMFHWTDYINSITFNNFDTRNVENMSQMFSSVGEGSNITLVISGLEKWDTSNVTNMEAMFEICIDGGRECVADVSHFATHNVRTMESMFSGCGGSIDVSSFDTSNVTTMRAMFHDGPHEIIGLNHFDTSNVTDMRWMFQEIGIFDEGTCESLDLSSFDTKNVTQMSYMFYGSSNLKTIYASEKFVTTQVTRSDNGSNMFRECTNLKGGAGTAFSSSYTDKTYARIDKSGQKGYFTAK